MSHATPPSVPVVPGAPCGAGFADPPVEAARAFRAAIDALSRPGRAVTIPVSTPGPTPPEGLSPAAAVLLLTLADPDTPVWLSGTATSASAPTPEADPSASPTAALPAEWLLFHTGAPRSDNRADASIAVGDWQSLTPLQGWSAGTAEFPDRAATLIVEVPALTGGPALTLTGPGIDGQCTMAPVLPEGAADIFAANAAGFPLGLDFFLTSGNAVIGLPRSTRVAAVGAA
ncbi:MAG: phosphonate C-P lyase system protein PhnH [Pseudomonadota bacterium]